MKKLSICLLLSFLSVSFLMGCHKKEEPITNKEESTIIKDAKNVDEYLKKQDYKSIAYAYIYNIKEKLASYESETNGSIKAKVAFFDYNIKYNSITYKKGNAFYSKDHSTSTFTNINNEFYMANKDKILVSRDLKKYDVYTLEEYKKVSYTPAQYTIMGYVFNDQSILKSEVISDKGEEIAIKYTLDNELATHIVKVDFKINGDLTSYPSFRKVELTLSMKRDFSPISYSVNSIYDASKPVIGSSTVTQVGECLFSKINEDIIIPNENILAEKLGAEPSSIIIDDSEREIKDDLTNAFKKLDFASGVNVNGQLKLNLLTEPIALNINGDVLFDMSRLQDEKIYNLFNFHATLEGDEKFNSLVSLIKTFAGEQLGEYVALLDDFKSLEVVYDNNGAFYLVPTNNDGSHLVILKIKLTDIADLLLKQINVYNLVSGANDDYFTFKKVEIKDENNYQVEVTLNENGFNSFKEKIESLFENEQYKMIKTLLSYKDFSSFKAIISIKDGKIKDINASLDYVKQIEENKDEVVSLLSVNLVVNEQTFDYQTPLSNAEALYTAYISILELKARLTYLFNNVYVNKAYLNDLEKAYQEYQALNDTQKGFINMDVDKKVASIKEDINNIYLFLETYQKYDLANLSNQDIYDLSIAYRLNHLNSKLLNVEIGEENASKLSNLGQYVDYSIFDAALAKINGEDETAWGLSEEEIKEIKLINDIASIDSSVSTNIWLKLMLGGKNMDFATFKDKIDNLYNAL